MQVQPEVVAPTHPLLCLCEEDERCGENNVKYFDVNQIYFNFNFVKALTQLSGHILVCLIMWR